MQEGWGQGTLHQSCTIPLLHVLFLILFIQVVFTFAASFFSPCEKDVCGFAPVRDGFLTGFFFHSNLHDLQLWRGFQSREPQYSFSWRKSPSLCHHLHQKPWRSLSQKGLFLCLRYSLVFGEYCLPIFPSPGFGRALSVSREISRLLCWNSVEARDE